MCNHAAFASRALVLLCLAGGGCRSEAGPDAVDESSSGGSTTALPGGSEDGSTTESGESSVADASTGAAESSGGSVDESTTASVDESTGGDESTGTADAGETTSDDGSTGAPAECEGTGDVICGVVTSEIAPADGNDGIGTLWIIATRSCSGLVDEQIIGIDADFSVVGNEVPFELSVPYAADWSVTAFLDENGNANPSFPSPQSGDMANIAGPFQLSCAEIAVDGPVSGVVFPLTDLI